MELVSYLERGIQRGNRGLGNEKPANVKRVFVAVIGGPQSTFLVLYNLLRIVILHH
jgi:hypothetical protein